MASADNAMAAHDYQKALDLYDGLIDWKGEGTVAPAARFKASMESVKCLLSLKQPKEGVERFQKMFGSYPELEAEGAYKHTLAVLRTLDDARADAAISIDLLELAKEKHPEQKEKFGEWVKKLMDRNLDSELVARLKKLGYL
ncbi:MAG: hypothetical protein V2A76_00490 [Planctomycetota bacterium]